MKSLKQIIKGWLGITDLENHLRTDLYRATDKLLNSSVLKERISRGDLDKSFNEASEAARGLETPEVALVKGYEPRSD